MIKMEAGNFQFCVSMPSHYLSCIVSSSFTYATTFTLLACTYCAPTGSNVCSSDHFHIVVFKPEKTHKHELVHVSVLSNSLTAKLTPARLATIYRSHFISCVPSV